MTQVRVQYCNKVVVYTEQCASQQGGRSKGMMHVLFTPHYNTMNTVYLGALKSARTAEFPEVPSDELDPSS